MHTNRLLIQGCTLELTCHACPEQYDVYFEDFQLGYLRLRHGHFRASYRDYEGVVVYSASPAGDGVFTDTERMRYLNNAVTALLDYHNKITIEKLYEE